MGIVYAMGEADDKSETLRAAISRDYSPIAGFSLVLLLLIAAPCMATVAVTRRESGSWKWAILQAVGLTVIGYVVALGFHQIAQLFV
jgi:ferrous iron transport protein B